MTERRPRRKRGAHARDAQTASEFAAILSVLLARVAGARGVALVDAEGETVDYAGHVDPFDLRVAAAHWQIVLAEMQRSRALAATRSFAIRTAKRSYLVWALPDRYAVVVLLGRGAGMGAPSRAFVACERALCAEAGWSTRPSLGRWFPVDVECDRRRRPLHVREHADRRDPAEKPAIPHEVHVLGTVVALSGRERGFRVRLASGAEITLLREPGGFWYADDELDLADRTQNPAEFPQEARPAHPRKKNL